MPNDEQDETVAEVEVLEEAPQEPVEDYKDRALRAQAELENMRKRFETDRQNLLRYGQEGLISSLLPVLDNFERATQHVPADQQESSWVVGIQYIQKNLHDVLEAEGLKEIAVKVGDHFDAHQHEALSVADSEAPDDQILTIVNKGYTLHGKLLRPVQVVVSKHSESKKDK